MVKKKKNKNIRLPWIWLVIAVIFIISLLFFSNKYKILSIDGIFIKPTVTPQPTKKPIENLIEFPKRDSMTKNEYVDLALEDLSKKLGIRKDDIEVVKVEDKSWSDTSLGCPQKGKMYAQVITSGYLIQLSYQGEVYKYNAGLERITSCHGS